MSEAPPGSAQAEVPVAELRKERIRGRPARFCHAVSPGLCLILGFPHLVAGLLAGLVGLGVWAPGGGAQRAPTEVVLLLAVWLLGAGGWLLYAGARVLLRRARWRRLAARFPGEPWRVERFWGEGLVRSDNGRRALRAWLGVLVIGLCAGLLSHWAFQAQVLVVGIAAGLADLALLAGLVLALRRTVRWARFGEVQLRLEQIPLWLNTFAEFGLGCSRLAVSGSPLTLRLRCVREQVEIDYRRGQRRKEVACYRLYEDRFQLAGEQAAGPGGGEFRVGFKLPADSGLGTAIQDPLPVYWELEVHSGVRGAGCIAAILLPIYARPRCPAA